MEKTTEQKIADLERKVSLYREREKDARARANQKARKDRDHRLIVTGGFIESVLGRPLDKSEHDAFAAFMRGAKLNGRTLEEVMRHD